MFGKFMYFMLFKENLSILGNTSSNFVEKNICILHLESMTNLCFGEGSSFGEW